MGMRRMMEFLNQHQLPLELAMPLYRNYGDVALEAVRSNPYLLSGWEFGVDFSQADALAQKLTASIDKDTEAFNLVSAAFQMPKETEEQKAARRAKIAEGMLVSTKVPFETMELTLEA